MKDRLTIFTLAALISLSLVSAQETNPEIRETESAEVSLEEYSDAFQEHFFEALKQKGIENYDKATNLLLECKRLDADNRVIDHELAKVYLKDKKYPLAEDHAITALNAEPENLWYLNTLVNIIQVQSGSFNSVLARIPYNNSKLKENLALVYYQNRNYVAAQNVLREVAKSAFSQELTLKVNDSIEKQRSKITNNAPSKNTDSGSNDDDPMKEYKNRITELMDANSTTLLQHVSAEALEAYPSQPFFYYANGFALNKNDNPKAAIPILEAALDYMLDDASLANKIYKELSDAYLATNNPEKANMYLSKIKSGF